MSEEDKSEVFIYVGLILFFIFIVSVVILLSFSVTRENKDKTESPKPTKSPKPTSSPNPTSSPFPTSSPTPPTIPPIPTNLPSDLPSCGVIRLQRVFPNISFFPNENIIELENIDVYDQNNIKIPYSEFTSKFGVANDSINPTQESLTFNENINQYGALNLLSENISKLARTKGSELLNRIFIELRLKNNQNKKISKIELKINPNTLYASSISKTQLQLYRQEDVVNNIPKSQPVFIQSFGPAIPINITNKITILIDNNSNKNCSEWKDYYCPFFTTQN